MFPNWGRHIDCRSSSLKAFLEMSAFSDREEPERDRPCFSPAIEDLAKEFSRNPIIRPDRHHWGIEKFFTEERRGEENVGRYCWLINDKNIRAVAKPIAPLCLIDQANSMALMWDQQGKSPDKIYILTSVLYDVPSFRVNVEALTRTVEKIQSITRKEFKTVADKFSGLLPKDPDYTDRCVNGLGYNRDHLKLLLQRNMTYFNSAFHF